MLVCDIVFISFGSKLRFFPKEMPRRCWSQPRALRIHICSKDSILILHCISSLSQFPFQDLFFPVFGRPSLGNLGVNSGMAL